LTALGSKFGIHLRGSKSRKSCAEEVFSGKHAVDQVGDHRGPPAPQSRFLSRLRGGGQGIGLRPGKNIARAAEQRAWNLFPAANGIWTGSRFKASTNNGASANYRAPGIPSFRDRVILDLASGSAFAPANLVKRRATSKKVRECQRLSHVSKTYTGQRPLRADNPRSGVMRTLF